MPSYIILNTFGFLLSWRFAAPTILRIALGGIAIYLGTKGFKENSARSKFGSILEIVSGLFILAGLFTQISALVLAAVSLTSIWKPLHSENESKITRILMLAVSLSLMLSGAGMFAFDLPL